MRESGVLMHITSLPGPCGVGTMGKHAFSFVDFLKKAGQSYWQILPLTPTGYGDSPYQSCSTYAGNYYLIDLPSLVKEGLLTEAEINAFCEGMPRYKRPKQIIFDRIPRNPTGKIEKPVLREKYCQGRLVESQITG